MIRHDRDGTCDRRKYFVIEVLCLGGFSHVTSNSPPAAISVFILSLSRSLRHAARSIIIVSGWGELSNILCSKLCG